MIYLELFLSFVQIGLFSIGGGYAAMPLIEEQVVTKHAWLTVSQFADVVTIAEMTPGPIALNAASFVGTQVCGIPGALTATFGCILPSCIIVSVLAYIYKKYSKLKLVNGALAGLRPAVVGMVASALLTLLELCLLSDSPLTLGPVNMISVIIFIICFVLLRAFKLSPIAVMLGAGVVGGIVYTVF